VVREEKRPNSSVVRTRRETAQPNPAQAQTSKNLHISVHQCSCEGSNMLSRAGGRSLSTSTPLTSGKARKTMGFPAHVTKSQRRNFMAGGRWLFFGLALGLGCVLFVPALASDVAPAEAAPKEKRTEPAFLVPPYLQLPTTTSMTIMWETNRKLPSVVQYGTTPDLVEEVADKIPVLLHEVALRGLQAGQTYFYRVRSGSLTSSVHQFKTAPPPGTKRWRLAVYGDSGSNPATHRKVVEQIAKAGVDLIVHTGDIVLNGKNHDTWRVEFFEPLSPLAHAVPWVSTIGNHERDAENYFSYMTLPGNE